VKFLSYGPRPTPVIDSVSINQPINQSINKDLYRVARKKRPELSHGVMQQSRWNESAEKHVCNEQTSSKTSMNFRLKRFHISRDTSEIVLHVIKQCLQAFYRHRNRFSKLMVIAGVSLKWQATIYWHRKPRKLNFQWGFEPPPQKNICVRPCV